MTIPSHMRDLKKNYGQMKKVVQLEDIQKTSPKEYDEDFVEIKERFSKLEKLIQESNKDEYYGWVMKKKKVKWSTLQRKKRLQSLVLRKDRELKKAELEQGLMKQEEVCSWEHETEIFLRKADEVDVEFKKNLMRCSDNGSHLKELMVRLS